MNEILDKLPRHLMSLVIDQPYNEYTAQDHALWRYVMRQNVRYLSKVAHSSYLGGLKKTGIDLDHIPMMYGMNRILKEIGWAAVAVDGFIPPSAFMEFQAYNVLVIAADIRPIDQIGYTSAPDIIHEAAGHAPIIADPSYAEYLKKFGEIGSKAFSSANDYRMYEAIRHLSILKADPYSDKDSVVRAEKEIDFLERNLGEPSELTQIRNLHWWTVEYGLVGTMDNPRIYGAGLLSSIAESYYCMQPKVKKIPYSLEAVKYSFDITEPQPQLFVTPDFDTLSSVLNEFANTMALRKGGLDSVKKAIRSGNTATCVWSSGLQVTGTFTDVLQKNGRPAYLFTTGPTSLCFEGKEIPGQNKKYHSEGFGSPVGKLTSLDIPLEDASDETLIKAGIAELHKVELAFDTGVTVKGYLKEKIRKKDKLLLMRLNDCEVTFENRTLFRPSNGMYDMAVGENIISAFSGPADPDTFNLQFPVPEEKTHKIRHTDEAKILFRLYQQIRDIREKKEAPGNLVAIWDIIEKRFPDDWLTGVEILEILTEHPDPNLESRIRDHLEKKSNENEVTKKLVSDGLEFPDQQILVN